MRIQLIPLCLLLSFNALAVDEKSMQELFKKYETVVDEKKIELIDEVFTEKFIKDAGGKKELVEKIKDLSGPKSKLEFTWRKGNKGEVYLAKVKTTGGKKEEANFMIIDVKGKPKIDGTTSDAE